MKLGHGKRVLTLPIIILSMIFFEVIHNVTMVMGWNPIFDFLKRDFYGNNLYYIFERFLWCIPCFGLIIYYNGELKYSLKNMFTKFDKKVFFICFGIVTVLNLAVMFFMYKRFNFNTRNIFMIFDYLTVSFAEELIFRGWIFNALRSKMSFKKANIIQSFYFLLAHWIPYIVIWTISGSVNMQELQYALTWNTVTVFFWGVVWGYLLNKTESLVLVMLIHAWLDYSAFLFYMG